MPHIRDATGRPAPVGGGETMLDRKASLTAAVLAFDSGRTAQWTPRDYATFANEGFMQNPIVYRSVRMIAEAAASIPLLLYAGREEIEDHPLLDLLARTSLDQTGTDFLEAWYGYLLVSGNAYAEAVAVEGRIREIHALRPDRMKVVPGPDGWPEAFEYSAGGRTARLTGEVVDGVRRVLHVRLFHPTNDHYGMSPIEAASFAIDTHNTAAKWNKALLDNSARPSGALVYASRDGHLTEEQFARLKTELEIGFQGARHAGRPLLLEGGLDWKPLSLTPKDMDFVEAKNSAAREIALALGVPPMLLGIPGDNTFANYQEASRSLWRQTVLPLVNRTAKALSMWLAPGFGPDLITLKPDLDQIEALGSEREALWARLERASFLTDDEKRASIGFGPRADGNTASGGQGDVRSPRSPHSRAANAGAGPPSPQGERGKMPAAKFNPYHDELGRFTTADGAGGQLELELVADKPGRLVNLLDEESAGGHTIGRHVGKSEAFLLDRIRTERVSGLFVAIGLKRAGSFPSVEAAERLINSTLAQNEALVDLVREGNVRGAELVATFPAPTGIEAYAANDRVAPRIRSTFGVTVIIRNDRTAFNGFRIVTGYPSNHD